MARADRRGVRSSKANAGFRGTSAHERAAIEDTLFFTRLRRHAKWMFVFLALVFGLGFVVFGIGSDQGTGIGDLLRDSGGASSDSVSVSDARERVEKNPKSADAYRTLATSLEEDGQADEAIVALNRYLTLEKKDKEGRKEALQELAGLHLGRAAALSQQAQDAQVRASYLTFGSTFSTPLKLGEGGATLGPDPIDQAVSTLANQQVSEAYTKAQQAYQKAEETYDRLAAAAPRDPNVQLELAQAAQQSGDVTKAIAAYERFIELAPDDPTAPIVRQQIAQLKASQAAPSSG
jgi:tetratricopeptide (TPR) repeat protein